MKLGNTRLIALKTTKNILKIKKEQLLLIINQ